MTVHVLHAGDGYLYLTRQVASSDVARQAQDPLVAYYQAIGNPPGVWVGAGCADLGMSGEVTEEHMLALYGEGLRPDANEFIAARMEAGETFDKALAAARLGRKFYQYDKGVPLLADIRAAYAQFQQAHGRRPSVEERRAIKESVAHARLVGLGEVPSRERVREYLTDELGKARQPVSGFDLVFSPVKSVSVLWGLAGHEIRRVVEQVHEQAWRAALAYGEREAGYTRLGAGGIAFAKVSGFVAVSFQHRDSRAGDPDLHTHMVVSNRVLAADGIWRTVDSRQLHRIAVSMSELYNTLIEQGLIEALGVRFVDIPQGAGKRPVREVDGLPVEWIRGFSRRRTQVETNYDRLVADYVARHGQSPPRSVQYQLAQQATLQHRPAKTELRTLAEQVQDWTRHAWDLRPGTDIDSTIQGLLRRGDITVGPDLAELAAAVVAVIAEQRSTWEMYHVRAEADRQLRPMAGFFTDADELVGAVDSVTALALQRHSIRLDVQVDELPRMLRHDDGESVFRRRGAAVYTSQAILDAEQRLVTDAHASRGAVVADAVRDAAIQQWEHEQREQGKDTTLNPGQRALVAHFVSSGQALAVGIGPPGTGKSTTMAAMRAVWEGATGGRVIGYAPSAAAASVLGDELGVRADTLHSLTVALTNGVPVDVRPGDLLLVDEAGMAGTLTLDQVRAVAAERGAVVRLLGDYRQLTAVEAGGALRLIHHDAGGVELNEVRRFTRPDEAQAVLRLRVGDERAVDFYVDNDRLVGGVGPAVLDRLYRDWKGDVDAGRTAIMISDSTHVARELSARAQTERRAAGLVESDGVRLHDGSIAGVGDRIVTRLNRRRHTLFGGTDFVKNGDLWEIRQRDDDGRLLVRHVRHGGEVLLPAAYVARFVELGYAATIHRSQGLTVDLTRAFLSATATREAALVALSRGRDGNYAYLDVEQILAVDEPPVLPGDLFYRHREPQLAEQALLAILRREGAELSATETLRDALEEPYRLSTLVPEYVYARHLHRGSVGYEQAEQWVRAAMPGYAEEILADEAWPELARLLHEVQDAGVDPAGLLRSRAADRPLHDDPHDPAESVAQVMHWRITADMPIPTTTDDDPDRPDLLPGWVATPPTPDVDITIPGNLAEIIELGTWLRGRAEQVAARVRHLGEHTAETAPAWAADLGPVPTDAVVREQWIRRAGQVAAYRERWQIPDTVPELLPDGRGEQARARAWVAAYLHAHPLEHAAADAARRATGQRGRWDHHVDQHQHRVQQEHADQVRRDRMAELLRQTWRHEQELVERIIAAAAVDTVAQRLHEAAEAGYDLHEVLAELLLASVAGPHIQDPAAYTAALIDIAVERIRSGEADRDAQRRAEQERFAQMVDQAADLVRGAWAARPDLAEAVIAGAALPALVRALDRYADAGLDARDLLGAIPLGKLDAPAITDPDRFAVYLLHRVARRQLDALDQARQAAQDAADQIARQRAAAALLRHAWRDHPDLADRVIIGPAFRFLAERMLTAQHTGHNVDAVLRGLDPVALTAPHIPSPSGAVTFAFTRALADREPTPATSEPHPAGPEPDQPDHAQPAESPAPPQPPAPDPAVRAPDRPRPADAGDQQRPAVHWSQRPHGQLADALLRDELQRAHRDGGHLARDRVAAEERAEQLHRAVQAGQSRHVRDVDDTLTQLREQARMVLDADRLETQWRATTERAADAAEQRAQAEHDLERLGRLARGRRAELTQRIDDLRIAEADAQRDALDIARRAAVLHRQTGPREQRQRIPARAQQAEADYPQARAEALQQDRADAELADRRAAQLASREQQRARELDQLRTEHELREQLPAPVREVEDQERGIAQSVPVEPGIGSAHRLEVGAGSRGIAGPHMADPDIDEIPDPADLDIDYAIPPPEPDDPQL
jgi:conjugative relaxase-like TrwC/TraI family protein